MTVCADPTSVYTVRDVNNEMAQLIEQLPQVERQPTVPGGRSITLLLRGRGSLFNPTPPADDSWLKGKLTPADFVRAVSAIDLAVTGSLVGLRRLYPRGDIPVRAALKARAAQAEVDALNLRWQSRGITFRLLPDDARPRSGETVLHIHIE
jgi:hypothetical protein